MHIGEDCNFIIVLTNLPEQKSALVLAEHLLELRLAACVNVLGSCLSMYHWQGKIETATEVPVLIKALAGNYPAIEQAIREKHPYKLPEIIALPVVAGDAGYLQWIGSVSRLANGRPTPDEA